MNSENERSVKFGSGTVATDGALFAAVSYHAVAYFDIGLRRTGK